MSQETNENEEFLLYLKEKNASLTFALARISKLSQSYRNSQNEDDPLYQDMVMFEDHLRDYRNFVLW